MCACLRACVLVCLRGGCVVYSVIFYNAPWLKTYIVIIITDVRVDVFDEVNNVILIRDQMEMLQFFVWFTNVGPATIHAATGLHNLLFACLATLSRPMV